MSRHVLGWHLFTSHHKKEHSRRYFAIYNWPERTDKRYRRPIEAHVETHTRWRNPGHPGFKIHFGNRGSETPFDGFLDLGFFAVYWGLDFPGLGAFCEWLGRGHKRDISLRIFGGSLWWDLWYDDDDGYDSYHRCDSWRQPKIWPWSRGRSKYRPWMCLRHGNIDLNPLDAFWGGRLYDYMDLEVQKSTVTIGEFPGDHYEVYFTLQKVTRFRRSGPKWARGWEDAGWTAQWVCEPKGIPFRNDSWKGDGILSANEHVSSPYDDWVEEAKLGIIERTKKDRRRYNYRPPEQEVVA